MEIIELQKELYETTQRLKKTDLLYTLAQQRAEAEFEYRKELQKSIVRLKEEGMSVTLIGDIARGECAKLKYKRDELEGKYNAVRDSMRNLTEVKSALQTLLKIGWEGEE